MKEGREKPINKLIHNSIQEETTKLKKEDKDNKNKTKRDDLVIDELNEAELLNVTAVSMDMIRWLDIIQK